MFNIILVWQCTVSNSFLHEWSTGSRHTLFLESVELLYSHMARSSTMPLKGELGGSSGELRGPSNGYLGSISSLAGSGLKTLAGLYKLYYFPFLRIFRKGDFCFLCTLFNTAHLPPVRFHCVRGCWDRTQDSSTLG